EPDDDWLRQGTAPEPENYGVLLPLADGIKVLFGQYQIGPYAIGIFDVLVPYAALAEVLSPELFPSQARGM
ncbi:RsiV family protein, partial [Thiohalocapsa marina]|uniref:RsiV family protein n=1 Tax=Thiohalocapsa marina TaxID=424902 RepID=UPI0036DCAE62